MNDEFNDWEVLASKLVEVSDQVVRKSAFDIQAGYQERVKVDTGFAKNSAYVATDQGSSYDQVQLPTKKDSYLLPEEKPDAPHQAVIGVGANYALPLEMGTAHMPPHPAMIPAVDAVRPSFEAALGKIEDRLREIRG